MLYGLLKDPLKCFRNLSSYLIMNNTFSDILLCSYKFVKYYWRTCIDGLIVSRLFAAPLYISFLSILFLALDRCFIICYPFKYRVYTKEKKIRKAMAVIIFQWLFAFLNIALKNDLERAFVGFRLLSGLFMLTCSCLFYIITVYLLNKEAKFLDSQSRNPPAVARENSTQRRKGNLCKQKRFLHTIMCITCLFVSTLSPLLIFDLVNENHGYGDTMKEYVHMCFYFLFYSNFVINSFVYYFRLTNYRKTFKLLLCCPNVFVSNRN